MTASWRQEASLPICKLKETNGRQWESFELIDGLDRAVDDAIFRGLARGQNAARAGGTRDLLRAARAGWAKIRRTEELGRIVESSISTGGSGKDITVRIGGIKDRIRKGTGKEGRSIQRTFEHDPKAKKEFMDFLDRAGNTYDQINVSLADLPPHIVGDFAGKIGDWMASIFTSTAGQKSFERLMITGNGKFTANTIATLANLTRREFERAEEVQSDLRQSR